jgi:DNA-directed RNA polymerase specialized sigma24 family protein
MGDWRSAVQDEAGFDDFVASHERELWEALVPLAGPDAADDALAEALLQAWLRWERVSAMTNPVGYVYTIARNEALRRRGPDGFPSASEVTSGNFEPGLEPALRTLSPMQLQVVYLVEGFGWGLTATARILDISVSTVRNHLDRGMTSLRRELKVDTDV